MQPAAFRGGLDAGGESVMPGVPCARAEAVMHSSLRLSGRRKGACGSSLWKQSGDSAGSWAGPPRAATPCVGLGVTGAKGTLAPAVTGGWPCPAPRLAPRTPRTLLGLSEAGRWCPRVTEELELRGCVGRWKVACPGYVSSGCF